MNISRRRFIKYGSILASGFTFPAWVAAQFQNAPNTDSAAVSRKPEIQGLVWVEGDPNDDVEFGMIELIPARFSVYGGEDVLDHEIFQFVAPEDKKCVTNSIWMTGLDIAFWYFYFLDKYFGYSDMGYDLSMLFTKTHNNVYPEEETFFVEVSDQSVTDLQAVLDAFETGLKVFRSPHPFMSNGIMRNVAGEKLVYEINPEGCGYNASFLEEATDIKAV